MGRFEAARWTRIWCVRPVTRRQRRSVRPRAGHSLLDLVERARLTGAGGRIALDRAEGLHLLAVPRIASDREHDFALADARDPGGERQVLLAERPSPHLAREHLVGTVRLRDQEHPRRVAVETVDDPGPQLAADAGQVADVVEEGIHERARRVARGGMDDEAGRLVDRDQVFVLVEDRERDVLGLDGGLARLGDVDRDLLARAHDVGPPGRASVDEHRAFGDELLDAGARHVRARQREKRVEAGSGGGDASPEPPNHVQASARCRRER